MERDSKLPDPGRRRFLRITAAAALGLAGGAAAIRFLFPGAAAPAHPGPGGRVVATPPPAARITPTDMFFVVNYGATPAVDPGAWRLAVTGLVEVPLSLTLDDLRAMPSRTQVSTLECVDNRPWRNLIATAEWRGVPMRELLTRAAPRADAVREIVFTSADGYSESHRLVDLMGDDVLLAYEMNGAPLPREHGSPLRLVMPDRWGYKQPKWIARMEAVAEPHRGYWVRRGWSKEGLRGGAGYVGGAP